MMALPRKAAPDSAGPSETVGQRLIAALVPHHFPTLTAVQLASGVAYSTLMNWKNGKKAPDFQSVEAMGRLIGRDPLDLIGGRSGATTALQYHRDFVRALVAAETRFPGRLPPSAYLQAGATCAAQWPETVDEFFLFDLASFWWKNASNSEVQAAEESEMRSDMAAIDAKR